MFHVGALRKLASGKFLAPTEVAMPPRALFVRWAFPDVPRETQYNKPLGEYVSQGFDIFWKRR